MINMGLVLEGGGMRCVYTAGVLETFLENDTRFPYVIGVSAGAVIGTSYISKQKGRNKKVTIDFVKDKRYLSLRNLIFKKNIFGFDFLFNQLPNSIVPFDYESFFKADTKFVVGVTNCKNGEAEYFSMNNLNNQNLMEYLKATSSIPFVSEFSIINVKTYLDGGLSDAIPLKKSIEDGNSKNIIVLTQNKGYRKKTFRFKKIIRLKYNKYPELVSLIENRHNIYNRMLEEIEKQEEVGNVIVIRPSVPFKVKRLEKNKGRLLSLYNIGKKDAEVFLKNYSESLITAF